MSRLFLDTEFNGFGGELISLALVADDGHDFYAEVEFSGAPDPFVREHVLPKLWQKPPLPLGVFDHKLLAFMREYADCEVVADWPADFEHLYTAMTRIGRSCGWINPVEFTARLVNSGELKSTIPHNALSDAYALRDWWLEKRNE